MGLKSSAHAKYDLKYHFVWCPKYRKVALKSNISKYVSRIIYEIAERYDFEVIELAVMPEHVHMFVSATPEISPARLIQIVKSITARQVFNRFCKCKTHLMGWSILGASLLRYEFWYGHHRRNDT